MSDGRPVAKEVAGFLLEFRCSVIGRPSGTIIGLWKNFTSKVFWNRGELQKLQISQGVVSCIVATMQLGHTMTKVTEGLIPTKWLEQTAEQTTARLVDFMIKRSRPTKGLVYEIYTRELPVNSSRHVIVSATCGEER